MAHELITSFSDFSVSSMSYGAPRTNARGGKSIKILDARKNNLILSTPLILTWGAMKMVDDDTGRVNYTLSLQFPNEQYSNDSTNAFFEIMKEFEGRILDDSVKHSKEWFGKTKMSREVAEALFTPILKYPKDKATGEPDYSRAPTVRVKIPYWEGKFNTELYDTNSKPIFNAETDMTGKNFENFIPKASHIVAAIQCNGLWFAAGKFGVTWQLIQAMVRRPVRVQGGCFLSLSSTDHQELDKVAQREAEESASAEVVEELNAQHDTAVADSDGEEETKEPEVVPDPEPVPVKKPKRKVVRKKVVKKSAE